MNKLYTLHMGSWDSHHLVGTFSTKEKAEKYVKFFKLTDNVSIEEVIIDPHISIIEEGKTPYLVTCKKGKDDQINVKFHHEHFHKDNVHFTYGTMYYFVIASNEESAKMMGKLMRNKLINEDWETNQNMGVQIL